jgi:hypothetical protein
MRRLTAFFTVLAFLFTACEGRERQNDIEVEDDVITTEQPDDEGGDMNASLEEGKRKSFVELTAIENVEEIPGASLKVSEPESGATLPEGKLTVKYKVDGFELGSKTSERLDFDIAESDKGQHIHAILNDRPYMAHYKPEFSEDLAAGKYLLLSFLSRSYHLSLKNDGVAELIQLTVGDTNEEDYDLSQPFLFYSRPKGSYDIGQNPDILLDFYLMNVNLSPDGYKVMAKIAGHSFTIDEWRPFIIQGLGEGLHAITLTLVDADGNTVDSPFNPVTRNIEVTNSKPNM